jgi:hypothetical protein
VHSFANIRNNCALDFPAQWLDNNLFTVTGLDAERKILKGHGFELRYE